MRAYVRAGLVFAVLGVALLSLQADAQAPNVIVSPQIGIFVGPGDQGFHGISVAFDSVHDRFLVVWADGGVEPGPTNLYGQVVNPDGTLYGDPIPIAVNELAQQPDAAFDPVNERFLVVWTQAHNGVGNIYGQLVSAEAALYGSNFGISPIPPDYHYAVIPKVQFDTINNRFFVIWIGPSTGIPYDVYGQFVDPDGSLHGSMLQLTDVGTDYYLGYPDMQFDPNNGRYLLTWINQSDGYIYGQLLSADGVPYGSEITVGYYGGGSYIGSLGFDPVHARFLQAWGGVVGQLIDADGSLYGTEFTILSENAIYPPSVAFDDANDKFLVASGIQLSYLGIAGQFVNPDGSLHGSDFEIFRYVSGPHTGGYWPLVASGSAQTGSLVVYMDIPYWDTSRYDILGNLVKLGPVVVGGIAELPDIAKGSTDKLESPADTSSPSAPPYVPLAGGAAALVALTAGAWYARRRWLR
jgi:hypothetical protein